MNETPVSACALALLRVIVNTDAALSRIGLGENALVAVGSARTTHVPVAGPNDGASLAVMVPVEFTYVPATALCTFTVTPQLAFGGIVPPESATEFPLGAALTVPPQVVTAPGEDVLVRFVG